MSEWADRYLQCRTGWLTVRCPNPKLPDSIYCGPCRADMDRVEAERADKRAEFRARLAAITDPLSRKMLDLHVEDLTYFPGWKWGVCQGCDRDGYESEPPPWPCATTDLVAEHNGIEVPR